MTDENLSGDFETLVQFQKWSIAEFHGFLNLHNSDDWKWSLLNDFQFVIYHIFLI